MSVIPCKQNPSLDEGIKRFAEVLKQEAHTLGDHGLTKDEFHRSGLFHGAIQRIRGQISASMKRKRAFAETALDYLKSRGRVKNWESTGSSNRYDYKVTLNSGRTAAIELKGCLDGNNTNIFERPSNAQEFIIWSVCTNFGADPVHNVWSGIHTRLSAEIISRSQVVDGLIVWDMVCGTLARPCPKIAADPKRITQVGNYQAPPPCIYVFPDTVPSPRNNPSPTAQALNKVEILKAFHEGFQGKDNEVNFVDFSIEHQQAETLRTTKIRRGGQIQKTSRPTRLQRS